MSFLEHSQVKIIPAWSYFFIGLNVTQKGYEEVETLLIEVRLHSAVILMLKAVKT